MKSKILRYISVLETIIAFCSISYRDVYSCDRYVFSYMTWQSGEESTIWIVDPLASHEAISIAMIPSPIPYSGIGSQISPNGEWNTIDFVRWADGKLLEIMQMIHLPTQYTYTFFESESGPLAETYLTWSSDSHYLAFNAASRISDDNSKALAYIYSVQDDNLISLETTGYPTDAVWSSDSTRIAILSWLSCDDLRTSCHDFNSGYNYLETFRISDGTREHVTTQINDIIGEPCKFDWSPDNRRLSFEIDCTSYYWEYVHDIYIWDIESDSIMSLTNHTALPGQLLSESNSQRTVYYSIWHDANTILVGEWVVPLPLLTTDSLDSIMIRTAAYTWPDLEVQVLSSKMAADWAVNPVTGELAFRLEAMEPVPDDDEIMSWVWKDASVHIATFEDNFLKITMDAPPGCNPKWSPDGKYLAYEDHGSLWQSAVPCREQDLEGFIFIERETGQISRYHLEEEGSVIPLGWVAIAK